MVILSSYMPRFNLFLQVVYSLSMMFFSINPNQIPSKFNTKMRINEYFKFQGWKHFISAA